MRTAFAVLMVAISLTLAACGNTSKAAVPKASAIAADRLSVAASATGLLAPLQLRIQRWSIEQRVIPPQNYELSLYTEPARRESAATYASRFAPLAAGVIPALFARYHDIAWIDLCQENAGTSPNAWEPAPVTRIEISRQAAAAIDWRHVDTAQLLARNQSDSTNVQIQTDPTVAKTPTWLAADARARATNG